MKPPRGLSAQEAAAWERLARTVTPLDPRRQAPPPQAPVEPSLTPQRAGAAIAEAKRKQPPARAAAPPARMQLHDSTGIGLDSTWERKLRNARIEPDFTLDLHGLTLDQAHVRLDMGLAQARAMGARLVLLVAGKPRPVHAADRGERRGAIRAKVLDWLAAGGHASAIAAIRKAHPRHGGEGALYLVLRRGR